MNKTLVAIVSKDNEFAISTDDIEAFYTRCPEHVGSTTVYKISNNAKPLPVVYNSVLDGDQAEGKDFIVFMHADVSLQLESLLAHIEKCKSMYDVMGLCGCSKMSVSESPLNWFTGSKRFPDARWGYVVHGELGDKASFFGQHSPDVADHSACCIDGLCIVLGPKALASKLRFDENVRFNCYDTQISFEAVMKKDLKLGVLVEKSLHHYSVGRSILSKEFLEDEAQLRKLYSI